MEHIFEPREFQKRIFESTARFLVAIIHRRAGKTVAACEWLCEPALDPDNPRYTDSMPYRGYFASPMKEQGLDNAWAYLCEIALLHDPDVYINKGKGIIQWDHGAQVQVIGTEHLLDRHRGKYADRIVLDETSQISPQWWRKVARPMLADREGESLFIGTVSGHDWFYDLFKLGKDPTMPSWDSIMLKASESGILPDEELLEVRREIGERDYAIEFECDVDVAPLGVLFGKESESLTPDRIKPIYHDPALPVFTGWYFANQSINVVAVQPRRGGFNVLRYQRWASVHISEVVRAVMTWPYLYGRHYGGGKLTGYTDSRISIMNNLGVALQISDNSTILEDNIHDMREMLLRTSFNVQDDDEADDARDMLEAVRTAAVKFDEEHLTYGAQTDTSWQLEAVQALACFAKCHKEASSDWSKPIDYAA